MSSSTPQGEREAWLNLIDPHELDMHMLAVGQAETNAEIVREMFSAVPPGRESSILVHGCGTCQMFDYVGPGVFGTVMDFVFSKR
jgi:hypothetical protein